jgi:predicted DsbA family dithiol-disulfide isomerase
MCPECVMINPIFFTFRSPQSQDFASTYNLEPCSHHCNYMSESDRENYAKELQKYGYAEPLRD